PFTISQSVHANFNLTTPTYPSLTAGSGTIYVTTSSVDSGGQCSERHTNGSGSIQGVLGFGNLYSNAGLLNLEGFFYNIGEVTSDIQITCDPDQPPADFKDWWWLQYNHLEFGENRSGRPFDYEFLNLAFTGTQRPIFIGQQSAPEGSSAGTVENTTF